LQWQRKVIELQLGQEDHTDASSSIDEYLKYADLANSERAWAMGQKAHLLADRNDFDEARQLITQAMKLVGDEPSEQGQFYYWLGHCEWKLGRSAEAERLLRVARDLLRVQHPLDAEAALALGQIRHEQKDYAGANAFYAAVLQSHMDSPVAPSARLARGVCRIALGENDAGLSDLEDLARRVVDKPTTPLRQRQEVIGRIQEAIGLLAEREQYQAALELIAYEQELQPKLPSDFFGRLAGLYEKRSGQLEKGLEDADLQERLGRQRQARECRTKAGDAYIALSKVLTLKDDKGHGQAMWKAIELYEQAAELPRVISAMELFVGERPEDPQAPEALLKLGQSYQAAGLFDKAIEAYRQNQFRYPKSLAASKSGVPLARAYIAKGAEFYKKAETALLAVVENNPQITPEAEEFRESLWELANLYYRTSRFELAIARLEEMTQRYPNDPRMGQLFFVMADSYRKSAGILDERLAAVKAGPATQPTIDVAEATRARTDRLKRAKGLYDRTIEHYRLAGAARDLDKLYLKLGHFYRGDCVYDLGDYAEAIKLYGDAAFRYQDDSLALAAYVQIVNSNVALGKTEEAKAANERAKWMLRRMPAEAFSDSSFGMPKPYWEQWLKWSSESGMWK
jgi:tetratricopeptide (TPR) repeat protein